MKKINQKGITLIALIITLIVLLIIASVTINLLLGDNNIIETAGWTTYVIEYEKVNEKIELYSTERLLNQIATTNRIASVEDMVITTEQERKNMYPVTTKVDISELSVSLRQAIKQIEGIRTKDLNDETLVNLYKVDLEEIEEKTQKEYIVNILSGNLYSVEYQKYKGNLYHTPRVGIEKNFQEIVPNIDEAGKYEMVINAGQIVEWDSIIFSYGRYVNNSVSIKVYTSDDEIEWTEETVEIGNKLKLEETYNIIAQNKTQYLKIEIDVKEVNGKCAEIDYILVNFYKYRALPDKPTISATGVEPIGDTYVVPTPTDGPTATGGTKGKVIQTIHIPENEGDYILDPGEKIGNPVSTVTVTINGIPMVYDNVDTNGIKNIPVPPGATVQITTPLEEGEGIKEVTILKKEPDPTPNKIQEIETQPETTEKEWVTETSKKYIYNNGGSGYWQKCLINDIEVNSLGIIEQGETKRIRVTYQVSEDGRTWSRNFTNIQDGEQTRYLKVNVEYQVVKGNKYGNTKDNKIKIILNDGTWTIDFKDNDANETLIYRKRVYFSKNNKQGTLEVPNYVNAKSDNTEFKSWISTKGEYLPGETYTATADAILIANYIMPTVTIDKNNIKQNEFSLQITTNYTDLMVDKYIYYISGKQPIEGDTKTPVITKLQPETQYTVYVEACSKAGKTTRSNTIIVTTLEADPPEAAEITFDKTNVQATETIKATIKQQDIKSGINITKCKYIIAKDRDTLYGENSEVWDTATAFTQTPQTIDITKGQEDAGSYYVHVLSVDNVGNKRETVSGMIKFKGVYVFLNVRDLRYDTDDWEKVNWNKYGSMGGGVGSRPYMYTKSKVDVTNINTLTFKDFYLYYGNNDTSGSIIFGLVDDPSTENFIVSEVLEFNGVPKPTPFMTVDTSKIQGRYYIKVVLIVDWVEARIDSGCIIGEE